MPKRPFNLNLLTVLVAVADARSITGAAAALHMSQPGLSTALLRIRRYFDDPVFVRTGNGMEPTARGEQLILEAREVLNRVTDRVLKQPDFDPAQTSTEFRFAMAEIAQTLFLPRLLKAFQRHAPHATLHAASYGHETLESLLENGRVDLAFGYLPDLKGSNIYQQQLFLHGFCCLLRAGHPSASNFTKDEFLRLEHVLVETPVHSHEIAELYFARHRVTRKIRMRTSHFLTLPSILTVSDMVATVPLVLGTALVAAGNVVLVPQPYAIPRYRVGQYWHRRFDKDPRIVWLRGLTSELFGPASDFMLAKLQST